ncbi:MAG: DNA-directed RNA polymerase subunit alpha [Thermodesulfobacteriota bacterium]
MEPIGEKNLEEGTLKEFQKNWKDLIHPRRLEKDEKVSTPTYTKFVCEPLERGYGVTLGNSLRRVLLSSIQGPAITSVKIDGVLHEFSTISGVKEDVTEIILNLKSLNLEMHTYQPQILILKFEGPGNATATNIEENHQVSIINSDQHIATVSEGGTLEMEMTVEMGRGYEPVERRGEVQKSIGNIPIDALFSPIRKVNYTITNSRVGRRTDYEKLTLEIWSNGTISPEDALAYSAKIIKQQLSIFINFDETVFEDEEIEDDSQDIKGNEEVLFTLVEDIDLSARSLNCLRKANIVYLGELIQKTEDELLNLENFGKRSLVEIKEKLDEMSLELGADINIEVFEQEKENRSSTTEETE